MRTLRGNTLIKLAGPTTLLLVSLLLLLVRTHIVKAETSPTQTGNPQTVPLSTGLVAPTSHLQGTPQGNVLGSTSPDQVGSAQQLQVTAQASIMLAQQDVDPKVANGTDLQSANGSGWAVVTIVGVIAVVAAVLSAHRMFFVSQTTV